MVDDPERLPDKIPLPQEQIRTSDSDRERVAAILRTAAAEGRLELSELDDRLSAVYAAKTYGELEPLVRDLPVPGTAQAASLARGAVRAQRSGWLVAVLSGFTRVGRWQPPQVLRCLAFWGGGKIDLRSAQLVNGELRIQAYAVMGGMTVIVPPDAEVHVTGIGLMGGFNQGASGLGAPGGPRVIVSGLAFWGGVDVRRKPLKREE